MNQSPSGSGRGKLAGGPGTSRKRLHELGSNSAQQWRCPDPSQLLSRRGQMQGRQQKRDNGASVPRDSELVPGLL